MGEISKSTSKATKTHDERLKKTTFISKLLNSPEMGAFFGTIFVFIFFLLFASDSGMFSLSGVINWLEISAQLGILAVGACLLMIAGEFDLSVGSMIGFAGIILAILITIIQLPVGMAIFITFLIVAFFGFLNGLIVVKTGLPSFIVTLAFLYILRGLSIGLPRLMADRTLIGGILDYSENSFIAQLFGGEIGTNLFIWLAKNSVINAFEDGTPEVTGIPMVVVWWFVLTVIASFVLLKTPYGNWIFSIGGNKKSAESMGIPVNFVKISLFIFAAICAAIFAACQVFDFGSADSQRGILKEFEAIIAAVIGGSLLTGGYGSVIGAAMGALIFGVVQQGIFYTGINTDWFRVFLGVMLLIAVLLNNYMLKRASTKS